MALLRRLSPLLLVAAALAGCAPAATGTSPASPYPIASQDISTTPNGTVYLEAHYTFADLKIDPTKVTGMMWVPRGYSAETAVFTSGFDLSNVQVPQGWSFTLTQVMAVHTTVAAARTIDRSKDKYTLDVLLKVHAKPQAVAGPYHLRATLTYQQESKPLHVALTVAH